MIPATEDATRETTLKNQQPKSTPLHFLIYLFFSSWEKRIIKIFWHLLLRQFVKTPTDSSDEACARGRRKWLVWGFAQTARLVPLLEDQGVQEGKRERRRQEESKGDEAKVLFANVCVREREG